MARPKRLPKFVKLVKPTKQAKTKFDLKSFAETQAKAFADGNLGKYVESSSADGLTTFVFEANLKGYSGWRYSVSVFQVDPATEPTVSEIVLLPGPDSLIAPDWVPWADRLADYQALQAELEKQGELEHEEISHEIQEELAILDFEERENAEENRN